jgi:plasmid stabilization system protein ParE
MIVRFTRRAESDLNAIHSYLVERSPQGAANVGASLQSAIWRIALHPAGATKISPTLFVKILTDHPYKIFYRVRDNVADIIHVRHAARRQWPAQ